MCERESSHFLTRIATNLNFFSSWQKKKTKGKQEGGKKRETNINRKLKLITLRNKKEIQGESLIHGKENERERESELK